MNDMTESTANEASSVAAQTGGYGKYDVHVSYADGIVRLTLRHVANRLLPVAIFGRVVMTKMVRLAVAGQFEAMLLNGRAGLVCENSGTGLQQRTVILDSSWPIDVRENARKQIDAALHGRSAAIALQMSGPAAIVGGIVALFLVAAAFGSGPSNGSQSVAAADVRPASEQLTPNEAEAMSSAVLASKAAEEQGTGMERVAAMAKAQKIQVQAAAGGKPTLVVWSDPLCPNCRDFEQKVLIKLPAGLGITVVPVSFKEGSRPLVSYVACGSTDSDRAARWKNLMSLEPDTNFASQCKSGPSTADGNSILFARAGLTATPTLMSTDGRVFDGDRNSPDAIAKWLSN